VVDIFNVRQGQTSAISTVFLSPAGLSDEQLDSLSRCNDADTLIFTAEAKQMPVSRNDKVGLSADGAGEHVIIIGVGRHSPPPRCRLDYTDRHD
jgi:hypothetical protein